MSLKKPVYSVLVVSAAENFTTAVSSMLSSSNFKPVAFASNISEAQREINQRAYDFVIIDAPLPDDLGLGFAVDTSSAGSAIVLLLLKSDVFAEVYEKASEYGVFVMPKPLTKQYMITALMWMRSAKEKLRKYEKKTTSIEDKMQEIRLVNRAKWLLISKKEMPEPEAHRYIEKTAMDLCISKKEVARQIISENE